MDAISIAWFWPWRDPLKLLQAKIESGPTEGRTDEAITVYGRADHRGPAGAGGRDCDGRGLPQARGQLSDLLQVEGQVRRSRGVRGETTAGAGGRERSAEADACGDHAGQCRVEGSAGKKVVTPAARREAARYLRQAYEISERRACRVIGTDRTSVRYQGVRPADNALRERLKALAEERRRFGYRRCTCAAAARRPCRQQEAGPAPLPRGAADGAPAGR